MKTDYLVNIEYNAQNHFISAFLSRFLIITIPRFIRQILREKLWIPDKKYFVDPWLLLFLPSFLPVGKQSQLLLQTTEVELGLKVGVEFDNTTPTQDSSELTT